MGTGTGMGRVRLKSGRLSPKDCRCQLLNALQPLVARKRATRDETAGDRDETAEMKQQRLNNIT